MIKKKIQIEKKIKLSKISKFTIEIESGNASYIAAAETEKEVRKVEEVANSLKAKINSGAKRGRTVVKSW